MSWNTKKCKDCGIFKPLEDFDKTPRKNAFGSGLRTRCRPCQAHYMKQWVLKNTRQKFNPPPEKKCTACKQIKLAEHFCQSRGSKDGLNYICRECAKEYDVAYRSSTPRDLRAKNLWANYRITTRDYDSMVEQQKGLCPICAKPLTAARGKGMAPVDHDHETNRIRGVLCHKCNLWLGLFEQMKPGAIGRIRAYLND